MANIEALTDTLLRLKLKQSLSEFIAYQVQMGNDATGIIASLHIATGEMFDRRTVVKWMDTYQ